MNWFILRVRILHCHTDNVTCIIYDIARVCLKVRQKLERSEEWSGDSSKCPLKGKQMEECLMSLQVMYLGRNCKPIHVSDLKEAAAHLLFHHKSGIYYEFACTYQAEGRFHWVKKDFLPNCASFWKLTGANTDVLSSKNPSLEHSWFQKKHNFSTAGKEPLTHLYYFLRSKRGH